MMANVVVHFALLMALVMFYLIRFDDLQNIDDCWSVYRNQTTGKIVPDYKAFPSGIDGLAKKIHAMGLKLGIYGDAGTHTCQYRPGSLGFETTDAQQWAVEWGLDYVKFDNCYNSNISPQMRYPVMRNALLATGKNILYSLCEWGVDDPAVWAGSVGNSWRTTDDISNYWLTVMRNLDLNDRWASYAGPGTFAFAPFWALTRHKSVPNMTNSFVCFL